MSDASSSLRDTADGMGESRVDLAGSFENFQQRFRLHWDVHGT